MNAVTRFVRIFAIGLFAISLLPAAAEDVACGGFMAWSQPTQGATQVSPTFSMFANLVVGDRLEDESGERLVVDGVPLGPVVLQAKIPLVQNRETFLIGVPEPFFHAPQPARDRKHIRFDVWSRTPTVRVAATLRTTIKDAGGNVLYRFNPSRAVDGTIRTALFPTGGGGPCSAADARVDYPVDFPVENQSVALNAYRFHGATGNYSYETEVREYDPQKYNGWGKSLGYVAIVKFKTVATRMPKIAVYPGLDPKLAAYPFHTVDQRKKELFAEGLEAVGLARQKFQAAFPLPFRDAFGKLQYSTVVRSIKAKDQTELEKQGKLAATLGKLDKAIYYLEGPTFTNLAGNYLGYTKGDGFAAVRNEMETPNWGEDLDVERHRRRRSEADTIVHEVAHMTRPGSWADLEMTGECGFSYHNNNFGTSYGVRVVGLDGNGDNLTKEDFELKPDVMAQPEFDPNDGVTSHANQCTWWNITTSWSKPKIDPPLVLVVGHVEKGLLTPPRGELARIYHRMGDIKAPEAPGPYRIELRDAFGSLLDAHAFEVGFKNAEAPFPSFEGTFAYELEAPPGLWEIQLYEEGTLLDTRRYSPNAPALGDTLTLNRMPGFNKHWVEFQASWTGTDRDFWSDLAYTLLYSEDGGETYLETGTLEESGTTATVRIPRNATHLQLWVSDGARSDHGVFPIDPLCFSFLSSCSLNEL